jgi:cytosol aminopeptidase
VTQGTSEPAKFLEMYVFSAPVRANLTPYDLIYSHYKGAPDASAQPVAFVGKGITFDSGGISLKPGLVSAFRRFFFPSIT